jgi:hypothetical protein
VSQSTARRLEARPLCAALLSVAALLGGCGVDAWYFSSITSTGQGATLILVWQDSPLDEADRLWVALDRVELLGGPQSVVLLDRREEHDMLTLQNGTRVTLDAEEVPAGTYSTVRLTFAPQTAARHRIELGGVTHALRFARTGGERVDVHGPFTLAEGETQRWVLDLNARLSVLEAAGDWWFDPQVAWTPDDPARLLRGSVRSAAGLLVAGATVSAQRSGRETASARTRSDGTFELGPLPVGAYMVVATAPGPLASAPASAQVSAGGAPPLDLVLAAGGPPGGAQGLAPTSLEAGVVWVYAGGVFLGQAGVDPLSGAFVLPLLVPGLYSFVLYDASGLVDRLDDQAVVSGQVTPLDFGP